MALQLNTTERVVVLVKALPQPSKRYGETVCCAGLTSDGSWRRLYPVRFRHLEESAFDRWQWISYRWEWPRDDKRQESRRIHENSIHPERLMPCRERARLIAKVERLSTTDARNRGESLCILKSQNSRFYWRKKTLTAIRKEKESYEIAARQLSLLDRELQAYQPAPYEFKFKITDQDGGHDFSCQDWETHAAFWKLSGRYGEEKALQHLTRIYNEEYPRKGFRFALGTVKKRPEQWLLLGVLRVDDEPQADLF